MCEYSSEQKKKCRVFPGPRVGLFLTKRDVSLELQLDYMMREYRFCSKPKKLWKGKHYLVYSLICRNEAPKKIADLTGVPFDTVKIWINAYKEGKSINQLSAYTRRLADECQLLACFGAIDAHNQK